MFLEVFFAQGVLVSKDIFHNQNSSNLISDLKEVCQQIEKLALKYIDEYLQRKVSIFNTINKINYGSKIASIVLYKARKEVLEKK